MEAVQRESHFSAEVYQQKNHASIICTLTLLSVRVMHLAGIES